MLKCMNIKGNCSVKRENSCLYVDIEDINSSDMGIVIGRRGSTLDAIQFLIGLALIEIGIIILR